MELSRGEESMDSEERTKRQRQLDAEVKRLRQKGKTNAEIAKAFGISKSYASHIYARAVGRDKMAADDGYATWEDWVKDKWVG